MMYSLIHSQHVDLNGETITICTKAGMVEWDEAAISTSLIAEGAAIEVGRRVLLLEGGSGALAVSAAMRGAQVDYYDANLISARMAQQTISANTGTPLQITIHEAAYPAEEGVFDVALMVNPKGRAYTRLLLEAAHWALKPGGVLYFAGAKAAGVKAIMTDAQAVFGQVATVNIKAHHRLCMAAKAITSPPTPLHPMETGEINPFHNFDVNGLTVLTLPGVFSSDGLDEGTAMLLSTIDETFCYQKGVLDVGCGAGVIGMIATRAGAAADLIDVNWLALDCAREGITANGLEARCRVFGSDLYSDVEGKYDIILSNPPFHSGHGVDLTAAEALITGARDHLAAGGVLRLVANRFLPYDKLLQKVFGNVNIVRQDGKFWVLEGKL